MEQALRQVIASYGYEATHDCLLKIMKDDYSFLQKFYEKKEVQKKEIPVVTEEPKQQIQEIKTKKPVKKKEKDNVPITESFTETAPEAVLENDFVENMVIAKHTPIIVNKIGSDDKPHFATKKEGDEWQKQQEAATRLRLESEGTNPESLLTEENLRNWIEKDGETYAVVARKYVGVPEATVSEVCKSYGIESEQAKRRRMIMAQKANFKKGKKN